MRNILLNSEWWVTYNEKVVKKVQVSFFICSFYDIHNEKTDCAETTRMPLMALISFSFTMVGGFIFYFKKKINYFTFYSFKFLGNFFVFNFLFFFFLRVKRTLIILFIYASLLLFLSVSFKYCLCMLLLWNCI